METIPTLHLLTLPMDEIEKKALKLERRLNDINSSLITVKMINHTSKAGGGALPVQELPTKCIQVMIKGINANEIEHFMRSFTPPIIGRIVEDAFVLDLRTVQMDEIIIIISAFEKLLSEGCVNRTPTE
jgi:L-seryl-tRNA(Ser) seleniumtransferase